MKDIIKQHHENGFATLPIKEDKSPYSSSWLGGVSDLKEYEGAHGVGIVCGEASGGLEVLDFDNHFGDAKKTISSFLEIEEVKDIILDHGLPIITTMSGGYHIYFRSKNCGGNQKLASRPKHSPQRNKYIPDAIIETRGEGGYVVAPPSEGYKLLRNKMEDFGILSEIEREILITAGKSFQEWDAEINNKTTKNQVYTSEERVGDRYNNDASSTMEAKAALIRAGWTELDNGRWRRPDKKIGVSGTFGKVAPNVWYCFTTNGYPFEDNKGYSPFQVVGLLDYDGDFSAFAKDLAARYNPKTGSTSGRHDNVYIPTAKKGQPKTQEEVNEYANTMEELLASAYIDTSTPVQKPPVVISIRESVNGDWQRFGTLGNFSVLTGKAKSKKTFFSRLITAAAVGNSTIFDRIRGELPESKRGVLRFDTEQSNYDAYWTAKGVERLSKETGEWFATFDLREHNPMLRCEAIEYALEKYKNDVGFVVIDGIADLAKSNNDEEEATRVGTLLMKWTKLYNMHIMVIIHQTKADGWATGHLGSYITKKAEAVVAVNKVEGNKKASEVVAMEMRGVPEFEDFTFHINNEGVPVILGRDGINTKAEDIHANF